MFVIFIIVVMVTGTDNKGREEDQWGVEQIKQDTTREITRLTPREGTKRSRGERTTEATTPRKGDYSTVAKKINGFKVAYCMTGNKGRKNRQINLQIIVNTVQNESLVLAVWWLWNLLNSNVIVELQWHLEI